MSAPQTASSSEKWGIPERDYAPAMRLGILINGIEPRGTATPPAETDSIADESSSIIMVLYGCLIQQLAHISSYSRQILEPYSIKKGLSAKIVRDFYEPVRFSLAADGVSQASCQKKSI